MAIYNFIQQVFDSNPKMASSILTFLGLMFTTWLARYKIAPSNWILIAARVFLGAVFDQIHPAAFKKLALASRKAQLSRKLKVATAKLEKSESPVEVPAGSDTTVITEKDVLS